VNTNAVLEQTGEDGLHDRVLKIEGMLLEMNDGFKTATVAQTSALERHAESFERLAQQISAALGFQGEILRIQSQSLSLPLVKEILLPLTFKIFGFFAFLVIGMLTAILGIKWAFADLLR